MTNPNNILYPRPHLLLYVQFGEKEQSAFRLRCCGELSLKLAKYIANDLWTFCDASSMLHTSVIQELYEAARLGVVPLLIIYPGRLSDILDRTDQYNRVITRAVNDFVRGGMLYDR